MGKKTFLVVLCLGLLVAAWGCAAAVTPAAPVPGATAAPAAVSKAGGQWDDLVVAAKKEGTVNLYASGMLPATRDAIIKAFRERYGIDVDVTIGAGGQMVERLAREARAGLNIADVGMTGPGTLSTLIKPLGVLDPLDRFLVLPEVTDPGKWRLGKLPYFDDEHQAISLVMYTAPQLTLNTQMVKPGEIASYQDLLAPKWKGQIQLHDPTIPGGGAQWTGFMVHKLLGMEKGLAFMRQFARQEPVIARDHRQITEWLARGKYPVAIGVNQSDITYFMGLGAPLNQPRLKEPFYLSFGWGLIQAFKNAPHPNAQKLFINWMLSKDGGSEMVKTYEVPFSRIDVPVDGVDPALIPSSQDIFLGEDFQKGQSEYQKLAREVFASQLK